MSSLSWPVAEASSSWRDSSVVDSRESMRTLAFEVVPTVDKCDVELPFELGDRGRERGLRHVAGFCCPREVSFLGYLDEVLQLTEQHERLLWAAWHYALSSPAPSRMSSPLAFISAPG